MPIFLSTHAVWAREMLVVSDWIDFAEKNRRQPA